MPLGAWRLVLSGDDCLKGRAGVMDRATRLRHITEVDRHVSECERGICEQEERIADMDRRGHDTAAALDLLETFRAAQTQHLSHRDLS
jgi:hypothetical protein